MDSDTHPIRAHGKHIVGIGGEHIDDTDIPISRKKTTDHQHFFSEHRLRNKDTGQETHAEPENVGNHIDDVKVDRKST